MIVRVAGGLAAALGLAAFASEAAAQYSPQQYPYPQNQYRGAPLPDDDDDDVPSYRVPAPGPYGRQPSPYSREADRGPYGPDYRPRPPADVRDPYSQRYDQIRPRQFPIRPRSSAGPTRPRPALNSRIMPDAHGPSRSPVMPSARASLPMRAVPARMHMAVPAKMAAARPTTFRPATDAPRRTCRG